MDDVGNTADVDKDNALFEYGLLDRIEDIGEVIWVVLWRFAFGVLAVLAVTVVISGVALAAHAVWENYQRGEMSRLSETQTKIQRQRLEQDALRTYRLSHP